MQSIDWPSRAAVASIEAERIVVKVLILPHDGFCRGRDLPEQRKQQIQEAAGQQGMTLFQALSLRRQLLRSMPGGMQRFAASNAMGSIQGQQDVAGLFEDCVADALRAKEIQFMTEAEMMLEMRNGSRPRGPTPDILFARPVRISTPNGIMEVGWMDCKNFYGSALLSDCIRIPAGKLTAQAERYTAAYGAGGFIFAQGFCKDLHQHLPLCTLLDAVPVVDMSRIEAFQAES